MAFLLTLSNAHGKSTYSVVTPKTLDQGGMQFEISAKEGAEDFTFTISVTSKSGTFITTYRIWDKILPRITTFLAYDVYSEDKDKDVIRWGWSEDTILRRLKFSESKGVIELSFRVTKKELAKKNLSFVLQKLNTMKSGELGDLPSSSDNYFINLLYFVP